VRHWDRVANFSEWIDPFLANFDGISRWRQYRFYPFEGNVAVQVRGDTSSKLEWVGIKDNTLSTLIFDSLPPLDMSATTVPAAQRRPHLKDGMTAAMRTSCIKLMRQRSAHRSDIETHVQDVLQMITLLEQPLHIPLNFHWPGSDLLSSDGVAVEGKLDDNVEVNPVDSEDEKETEFQIGDLVLMKSNRDDETRSCEKSPLRKMQRFWLAEVIDTRGVGVYVGHCQLWWRDAICEFGRYRAQYSKSAPVTDWISEVRIFDVIRLTKNDTIRQPDLKKVQYKLGLWARTDARQLRGGFSDDDDDYSSSGELE
jgi:hypothetical protein